VCVVCTHPSTIPGWSEYLWIPGYSDKGGCVWCMPIPVQSRDGQSISGCHDTLTRGVDCVWCMPIPVQSRDGQSISGSRDTLTRGIVCGVCPSQYNPGMVSVSLDPGILCQGGCVCCMPIPVQSRDGQSISGSRDSLTRGVDYVVYAHPSTIPGWSEYLWIP